MEMEIKSYEDFLNLIRPMHRANCETMKLLASEQWFQDLVKDARKVAGWPPEGFKLGDKKLFKKRRGVTYFLPLLRLGKDSERREKVDDILSEIIKRAGLPENFRFHLRGYILYNEVTVPATNFVIRTDYSEKRGFSFPSIKAFRMPFANDIKLAKMMMKSLIGFRQLPPLLAKTFKPKSDRTLERDLKIEEASKRKKVVKERDEYEQKDILRKETDKDVARKVLGTNETLEDIRKKENIIKQARKRIYEAKKKRGWR